MSKHKANDLVTVPFPEHPDAANTYVVMRELDGESVLGHPLTPGIYLIRPNVELNQVGANLKASEEKQLDYASKYTKYLDFNERCVLESLCMFYFSKRFLSDLQKKMLSDLCGKIAQVYCNGDLDRAIDLVNSNKVLLDSFNLRWHTNFKKIFDKKWIPKSTWQTQSVFNIAGYVLSQLGLNT